MLEIRRGSKVIQYIFFEMVPSFIIGMMIFVGIILMFQILRLTDFAITHGLSLYMVAEIISYVCISMIPALLPMSLLFSVLMTYSRLSNDSEIVAMKASGLHMITILTPTLILSLCVAIISAQTSFQVAPWGNRQFEVLYTQLAHTKPAATIKSGTFSEGFFDLVVYANDVDSEKGILQNVFIYDERNKGTPLTIIAKSGQIIPDPKLPGHSVLLRLNQGDIHRKTETHTKIKFDSYDLRLNDPIQMQDREKSPQSLTLSDISETLKKKDIPAEEKRILLTEWHKRWAISVLCIIFALIGVALGINTNRRSQKAGGMILCVAVIILYWVIYVACEGFARDGKIPAIVAMWFPNLSFGLFALDRLRRNWN